jgi:response regulator RpfG family c-di-GMP phosphodiesterase
LLIVSAQISPTSSIRMKAAELLYKAKVLGEADYQAVVHRAGKTSARSEEVILAGGFMTEAALLGALAPIYQTNFVSSERLATADIPRATIELVPRELAEEHRIIPLQYDGVRKILSVGTPDPDIAEALDEVRTISGAKDIRAILVRPAAVTAAINKYYSGDAQAFAGLSSGAASARNQAIATPMASPAPSPSSPLVTPAPAAVPPPLPQPMPARVAAASQTGQHVRVPQPPSLSPPTAPVSVSTPVAAPVVPPPAPSAPKPQESLEHLRNTVSLIEGGRQEHRGHSWQVSGLASRLADYMGLDAKTQEVLSFAALMHDLGKIGPLHLTALNAAEGDEHKDTALKSFDTPARIIEILGEPVPKAAADAVLHMYERFDGKGFPKGLAGQRIPLPARMLAIVDTYADLIRASRAPVRKAFSPQEAIAELGKHGGKIFDQDLIDNFRGALLGAAKPDSRRMSSSSFHVPTPALIVDPNPEETNALEFLMTDQGFDVRTARSLEAAYGLLGENGGGFQLVISELDMPDGDGLELLEQVRKKPWGKDLPWIVLTKRQGGKAAQRSFALGVMDFMAKPASTDLVVAKSKAMLDKAQKERVVKGVSGSLSEMSLGDIVQVLFYGKKTGKLTIRTKSAAGEVHFTGGNIVDATWGAKGGKDAFYAMVRFSEGTFAFDPSFVPTTKVIEESNESLLLEGLRRMDEGIE